MEKKFTLHTKSGSARLFAACVAIILIFSFIACIFSSNGFTVKIEHITTDARGATLNGELYYPAATSDEDKLPAVIVAHGGGCAYGVVRGLAEELARRGFVVFNVSAYGSGLSEQPIFDESDEGINGVSGRGTAAHGLKDSIDFVKSLKFVDTTRIGITGHSAGSRRSNYAVDLDCGRLSYNDQMINILCDTFSQSFTREEIDMDADALAAERLTDDELEFYNYLAEGVRETIDNSVKAFLSLGMREDLLLTRAEVEVGGYTVMRNGQVNIGFNIGQWDSYCNIITQDNAKDSWFTKGETIEIDKWYVLDDAAETSTIIGDWGDSSVYESDTFKAALADRTLRMVTQPPETHSKNFLSNKTNANACAFFTAMFNYNRGELTDAATVPLAPENQIWGWGRACSAIAMLAMIAMLVPLASLLMKGEFFASLVVPEKKRLTPFNKKSYWLWSAFIAFGTFWCIYYPCQSNSPVFKYFGFINLPTNRFFPLYISGWSATQLLSYMSVLAIICLICWGIFNKKKYGDTDMRVLNVGQKFGNIMKALLLGAILLAVAYLSLAVIEYLFKQDYRLWQTMFTEMKLEYWGILPRYFVTFVPCFLILGMACNYNVRDDIPEWRDTLNTIVINSLGVWLCCLINQLVMMQSPVGEAQFFASFITYYYALLYVPITVFISRKFYKLTNSVWLGTFVNSFMAAWFLVSSTGINFAYAGTTFAEIFFGF
ncbi:MAG: hypothetical protein IJB09_10105 [Oscillospiraceae bacterium]|nr:hypothetical protein [Oscillospiraceae bacterium]MBQ4651316.1 hypothetical protein [Oscillospiraceae bacterium]